MHRQKGQSLLETSIVIAILGILGAIATPGLSEMLRSRKALAFAGVLHTELNLARNTAIMRGYRTVLCRSADGERCEFSGSWTRGFMSFIDRDGNGDRSADEPILRVTGAGEFQHLRLNLSESRRVIAFRPDGRGGGTNLTAMVCDSTGIARRSVVISVAGRVRMGQPAAGSGCP